MFIQCVLLGVSDNDFRSKRSYRFAVPFECYKVNVRRECSVSSCTVGLHTAKSPPSKAAVNGESSYWLLVKWYIIKPRMCLMYRWLVQGQSKNQLQCMLVRLVINSLSDSAGRWMKATGLTARLVASGCVYFQKSSALFQFVSGIKRQLSLCTR